MSGLGTFGAHEFLGRSMVWWLGVVVDTADPLLLGRARVRIFGYHHHNPDILPTDQLPWAQALAPLGNASAPKSPPINSFVVGFFMDGELAQQPVMIGVLQGFRRRETRQSSRGVSDAN